MSKVWQPTKDSRIKKRGKVYWARFEKKGVVVQESLKTQSFQTAVRLVDEIENCILLGVDWKKEHELFETAWPEFLIDKANGNKTKIARQKTMYEYTQFGETKFMPFFKAYRLTEIDDGAWEEFVKWVRKEFPNVTQFANMRKYLMGFLSWAYRKGKIARKPELFDPDAKLKATRESAGPGRAYTTEELAAMRNAAAGAGRFHLFMLMAQYMGMRPSEITQIPRDRVDLDAGVIRLRKADTKTHRARIVPIHPIVKEMLAAHLAESEGSPYLFPNRSDKNRPMDRTGFKKRWAEILEKAAAELRRAGRLSEAEEVAGRIYDFRHTFITHALKAKVNPVVVAEMTGTSLKMIQDHYLHLDPSDFTTEIGKVSL